jgi:hypothetical protein
MRNEPAPWNNHDKLAGRPAPISLLANQGQ